MVYITVVGHLLNLEGGQVLVHLAQHLVDLHPLKTVHFKREKMKGKIEMGCSFTKDRLCFISVFGRNREIILLKLENRISAIGRELKLFNILLLLLSNHHPLSFLDLLCRGFHQSQLVFQFAEDEDPLFLILILLLVPLNHHLH